MMYLPKTTATISYVETLVTLHFASFDPVSKALNGGPLGAYLDPNEEGLAKAFDGQTCVDFFWYDGLPNNTDLCHWGRTFCNRIAAPLLVFVLGFPLGDSFLLCCPQQ